MKKFILIICSVLLFPVAQASDYAYFGFEPQIVTNYVATKKKMGYVRITVELMITDGDNLGVVERHAPLLRDAIIGILGKQPEAKVKSIKGRNEIRKLCEEKVRRLLKKETGHTLIKKLLFTQWLDD